MMQSFLVGVKGFEPPAPCSQSTCATRLRYTPVSRIRRSVRSRVRQATLLIIHHYRKNVNPFF